MLLAGSAAARDLEIFVIDVEGGQATLIVTPAGQTLLIDAGYGPRVGRGGGDPTITGRDADRILAAARAAGVERIDYLLITHFHNDHVGGVPELAAKIPILRFLDYGMPLGSDRMATNGFRAYAPVRDEHEHFEPHPGDRIPLKGLDVEVVSASGVLLSTPLAGAGQHSEGCDSLENHAEDGTENFRSIGIRLQMGDFRFIDLGDLSGNTLGELACPINLLGRASVYLVPHHGNYDSNVPALVRALGPQAAVMNNGAFKGGDRTRSPRSRPSRTWILAAPRIAERPRGELARSVHRQCGRGTHLVLDQAHREKRRQLRADEQPHRLQQDLSSRPFPLTNRALATPVGHILTARSANSAVSFA